MQALCDEGHGLVPVCRGDPRNDVAVKSEQKKRPLISGGPTIALTTLPVSNCLKQSTTVLRD